MTQWRTSHDDGSVRVFANRRGVIGPSLRLPGWPLFQPAVGDVNGDHRLDVVVANGAGASVFLGRAP